MARSVCSSMSILANITLPSFPATSDSNRGINILHGPHQLRTHSNYCKHVVERTLASEVTTYSRRELLIYYDDDHHHHHHHHHHHYQVQWQCVSCIKCEVFWAQESPQGGAYFHFNSPQPGNGSSSTNDILITKTNTETKTKHIRFTKTKAKSFR